jgi:hypothetical protein
MVGATALLTPVLMFLALYFSIARKPNFASDRSNEAAAAPTNPRPKSPAPAKPVIELPAKTASVSMEPPQPIVAPRRLCAPADPVLGLAIVDREEVAVVDRPGGIPVEAWDEKPLLLDPRYEFQILEESGNWIRVQIKSPAWPPFEGERKGWIERKVLQRVSNQDERSCLFINVNGWREVTQYAKESIRQVALRVLREDYRCMSIGRGGYIGQGQRFFLTCYPNDGGQPYHYWFSISDDLTKRNFMAPPLMSHTIAEERCDTALRKAIARRAKIARGPADVLNIASRKVSTRNGIHYVTLIFMTIGSSRGPEAAYCLAPPSGDVEVTLKEQN